MEFYDILLHRGFVTHYKDRPVDPRQLERVLTAASNSPGFAQQFPLRFLVVNDASTRSSLQQACDLQRQRWLEEAAEWIHQTLARSGEMQSIIALEEAPCIVCVFGETEKPAWREAAWGAVQRFKLAALNEGLQAECVSVDSLDFLNALLNVPQNFSAVALLTLGEAANMQTSKSPAPDLAELVLPYTPEPERLKHWSDPVRLGELSQRPGETPRAFLSDKHLLINVIRTAAEIQACVDINMLFELITRTMSRLFRYDRASVAFLDPEDRKLRLRNIQKAKGHPVGENFVIALDESNVIGWVVLNRSGILRNEIADDDLFDEQMFAEVLRSDMIVPMISEGTVFGTLNCGSLLPHAFTQDDFEILREFGKLVGDAAKRLRNGNERITFDPLTGAINHSQFCQQLEIEVSRCRDATLPCAMLLLNLDRFRILNEGFGHEIGDRVLVSIAQVIRSLVRDVDILARYSGEEFAIILPEMGIAELRAVGERIRLAIEQQVHAMHLERIGVQTTISLGGAMIPPRDSCAQQLIALAKQALEEAKQGGRNQLQILDATRIAGATPR